MEQNQNQKYKLSNFIKELINALAEHGDIDVVYSNYDKIYKIDPEDLYYINSDNCMEISDNFKLNGVCVKSTNPN